MIIEAPQEEDKANSQDEDKKKAVIAWVYSFFTQRNSIS